MASWRRAARASARLRGNLTDLIPLDPAELLGGRLVLSLLVRHG